MKKGNIKKLINKIIFELKCRKADNDYYMSKLFIIDSCFKLKYYPPSFFMRHTKEEAEEIIKREREEELEKIRKLIDELED